MNRILLSFCCLFISFNTFGQSSKAIEADLLKTFTKVKDSHWWKDDLSGKMLYQANKNLALKLKKYITNGSIPKDYPFRALDKEGMSISTSGDSLFRIYSWDDNTGGTMRFYDNVIQYTLNGRTKVYLDTPKKEYDTGVFYDKVYTLKTDDQTYYLATFSTRGSSRYYYYGINVFSVKDGQLNTKTKLIKTKSALVYSLMYEYDASLSDDKIKRDFYFDPETNIIKFPLTYESGRITTKFITYKFNGKYFEKVKS